MENSIVVDDSDEDAARELDMQDASRDMLSTQSSVLTELLPSNPESQSRPQLGFIARLSDWRTMLHE